MTSESSPVETQRLQWLRTRQPFEFIQSQFVVVTVRAEVGVGKALAGCVPSLFSRSNSYHSNNVRSHGYSRIEAFGVSSIE